jgi:stress-induced-phosphoprotein 1
MKEYEKALEDAEQTVRVKGDWAKGWSRKGAALQGLGKLEEAVEAYERGLELDKGNAQMMKSLEDVRGEMEARKQRGKDSFGDLFGKNKVFTQESFGKLAANPETRKYLQQPDFVAKLNEIIADPAKLQQHLSDQRVLHAWAISMGLNMSMPGAGAAGAGAGGMGMPEEDEIMADEVPSYVPPKASAQNGSATSASSSTKATPPASAAAAQETEEQKKHREADALKEEGNKLYKAKKFDEAMSKYDGALALWPENIAFMNNKAAVLFEMGRLDDCVKMCEDALEKGREVRADYTVIAKVYSRMGNAYAKMEKLDDAIRAYEKSLSEHRTSEVVNKLHQTEQKKKEMEAKAYINPESAVQEKERGNALFKEGKFGDAIEAYSEAIKRNPVEPAYYSNRAACYIKLARFPDALKDADKCLELNPDFVKGYVRKGNAHFGLKEYHKALEAFDKGMRIDPNQPELKEGAEKVSMAMYREQASGEVDPERAARAMSDPEIQAILRDPMMMEVLKSMQENPASASQYLRNADIAAKIRKLIAAGVLQTR